MLNECPSSTPHTYGDGHYQIVVILEGIVEIGDPAVVTKHQHVPLLVETSRLRSGWEGKEQCKLSKESNDVSTMG